MGSTRPHSSTSAPMKFFSILVIMIATTTVTASEEDIIVPEPTPNLGNTEHFLQLKREIAELRSELRSSLDQHRKEVAKRFATNDELAASLPKPCHEQTKHGQHLVPVCDLPPGPCRGTCSGCETKKCI